MWIWGLGLGVSTETRARPRPTQRWEWGCWERWWERERRRCEGMELSDADSYSEAYSEAYSCSEWESEAEWVEDLE